MRSFKLDELYVKILICLAEDMIQADIARKTGRSPPVINQRINQLVDKGYAERRFRDAFSVIKPSDKGYGVITKMARNITEPASKPLIQEPQGPTVTRQESYRLKYLLKDPLNAKEPAVVLQTAGFNTEIETEQNTQELRNSQRVKFHVDGITAILNTQSLELYAPHIYSLSTIPSIISEAEAKKILDPIALTIEQRLQKYTTFKLKRLDGIDGRDTLYSERLAVDYAEEEHPMAEAKPKDYKFQVHHPDDGKVRAEIDYSRGKDKPEVELVHRFTAPADRDTFNEKIKDLDSKTMDANFNELFNGKVDWLRDERNIEAFKQLFTKQAILNQQYTEGLGKVNAVLEKEQQFVSSHNDLVKAGAASQRASASESQEVAALLKSLNEKLDVMPIHKDGILRRWLKKLW